MQAELILPILLQHQYAARDQQLVCKLLCVSKAVRSTALQLLHGRMSVTVAGTKAAASTEWLAKHLHLVQALHVDLPVVHPYSTEQQYDDDSDSGTDGESEVGDAEVCWLCPATEHQIAAAIQRAVAAPSGAVLPAAAPSTPGAAASSTGTAALHKPVKSRLSAASAAAAVAKVTGCSTVTQPNTPRSRSVTPEPLLPHSRSHPPQLQSFSTDTCSIVVLEQLPCSHLSRLHLQFAADHPPFLARAAAALARFTGLQELHIAPSDAAAVDEQENFRLDYLLPSLAGLSCLRSLTFEQLDDPHYLCYIPAQLQELSIGFMQPPGAGQVQLGHITSLSRLNLSNSSYNYWWDRKSVLDAGDVLPHSLQAIKLKDCCSVEPLLQLQHLGSLEVSNCTTAASQLQQLSALTGLQQLSVTCFGDSSVATCTPAWSDLHSLSLFLYMGGKELQTSALQQLGRAQGIVSLSLANFLVAASGLASVLHELTGLTKLSLEHGCWLMGNAAAGGVAAQSYAVHAAANNAAGAVAMHCGSIDCEKNCEAGPVVGAISALPHLQTLRCVWVPFGTAAVRQLQQLADHLHGGFVLHYCD